MVSLINFNTNYALQLLCYFFFCDKPPLQHKEILLNETVHIYIDICIHTYTHTHTLFSPCPKELTLNKYESGCVLSFKQYSNNNNNHRAYRKIGRKTFPRGIFLFFFLLIYFLVFLIFFLVQCDVLFKKGKISQKI